MEDLIKHQLVQAGLSPNDISVFEENEIDTLEFCSLTMEDLRILFRNKLGIVKKVLRVLSSHKQSIDSINGDAESGVNSDEDRSGSSSPSLSCDAVSQDRTDGAPLPEITFWPEGILESRSAVSLAGVSPAPEYVDKTEMKTEVFRSGEVIRPEHVRHGKPSPTIVVKDLPVKRTVTVARKHHRYLRCVRDSPSSTLHQLANTVEIVYVRNDDSIEIKGLLSEVKLTIAEINRLVQETSQFVTKSIEIEKYLHKYVIGLRGSNLMDVLDRSGVFVDVPARDSTRTTVTFTGLPENMNRAVDIVRGKYRRYVIPGKVAQKIVQN